MVQSSLTGLREVVEYVALLLASVSRTVSMRSTKRLPAGLWVPKLPLRHNTPWRSARSAALFWYGRRSTRPVDGGQVGAGPGGLLVGQQLAPQPKTEPQSQVADVGLQAGSLQRAVANAMPPGEHLVRELQQLLADPGRVAPSVDELLETWRLVSW